MYNERVWKQVPKRKEEAVISSLYSTTKAAELKGVTRQAILTAIARGALTAHKVGKEYVILPADLDAYEPAKTFSERAKRNTGKRVRKPKEATNEKNKSKQQQPAPPGEDTRE